MHPIVNLPLAGRLKNFHKSWELISGDPVILILIKSFKIFFFSQPVQDYVPRIPEISNTQRELEQAEIELMLRKGTISQIDHTQGEFISMLLLVEKKGGGQNPVINLKNITFFKP